jgi:hypothetical protein
MLVGVARVASQKTRAERDLAARTGASRLTDCAFLLAAAAAISFLAD